MLHAKPQGHRPFGSGAEEFWRVFTIYGYGGHLGHVIQTPRTNFRSAIPLNMKFGFEWPSGFGEEDLWKWWTMDDGRTDDGPWLYYKLTNEPKGSGELIIPIWHFATEWPLPGSRDWATAFSRRMRGPVVIKTQLSLISLKLKWPDLFCMSHHTDHDN